ncbi:ankyrin repeat-containing domain protein [Microdochium trichocladiopsis]|uniref:Ankyrin repeat-containing domain protein n=1 Tax=Microdochium trichocladiopsis TaxID=1682393 RepID=A0A9P8XVL5_9PEZI|nr:ankyrin repeat-containing domain protein [Microdochium trichocladiopsis]KAH7021346.1 ankyrin repeat-containing domain protein [Microdochium trichocladiopsis]
MMLDTAGRKSFIATLPPELMLQITHFLTVRDLAALTQTCQPLHPIATSALYKKAAHIHPTLLVWAVECGRRNTVQMLLAAGAEYLAIRTRCQRDLVGEEVSYKRGATRLPDMQLLRKYYSEPIEGESFDNSATPWFSHSLSWLLSPMHLAAFKGHVCIVEMLLDHGANVDTLAPDFCHSHRSRHKLLQRPPDDDDHIRSWSGAPGGWAEPALRTAICAGQDDVPRLLIARGASLNFPGKMDGSGGEHALHTAAIHGRVALIKWLCLESSHATTIDINVRDYHGLTPLFHAVRSPSGDEVRPCLLAMGADVDVPGGPWNCTPLQFACWNQWWDKAAELLHAGADPDALCTPNGGHTRDTPPMRAIDIVCVDTSHNPRSQPQQGASAKGRIEILKALLRIGASTERCPGPRLSPMAIAAWFPNPDAATSLLDTFHNASVQLDEADTAWIMNTILSPSPSPPAYTLAQGCIPRMVNDSNPVPVVEWLLTHSSGTGAQLPPLIDGSGGASAAAAAAAAAAGKQADNPGRFSISSVVTSFAALRDACWAPDLLALYITHGGLDASLAAPSGTTLLHAFLRGGHAQFAHVLLKYGAVLPCVLDILEDFQKVLPPLEEWERDHHGDDGSSSSRSPSSDANNVPRVFGFGGRGGQARRRRLAEMQKLVARLERVVVLLASRSEVVIPGTREVWVALGCGEEAARIIVEVLRGVREGGDMSPSRKAELREFMYLLRVELDSAPL